MDFTPNNHMFSNFRGAAGAPPPPGSAPGFPRYYIVMRAERPISLRFFKMF